MHPHQQRDRSYPVSLRRRSPCYRRTRKRTPHQAIKDCSKQQVREQGVRGHNKYGIKDLSEAISFLNIRILRESIDKKLWICQDGYIDKICTKYGIEKSQRTVHTPLASSYRPQPFEG